jgi:tellurite resistance protein
MRAVHTHSFKLIQAEDALLREVARAMGLSFSDVLRVGLYRVACSEGLVESAQRAMAERVAHLSDCRALWERIERD